MYIVHINFRLFLREGLSFDEDYRKATEYDTIGDAMRKAADINSIIGPVASVIRK